MKEVWTTRPHSLQLVVENPYSYPFLPIVYLLIRPARIVDALYPKRNKARAEIIPIYIYIKRHTHIYNRVKENLGKEKCEKLIQFNNSLFFVYMWGLICTHSATIWLAWRQGDGQNTLKWQTLLPKPAQTLPFFRICGQLVHTKEISNANYTHHS